MTDKISKLCPFFGLNTFSNFDRKTGARVASPFLKASDVLGDQIIHKIKTLCPSELLSLH